MPQVGEGRGASARPGSGNVKRGPRKTKQDDVVDMAGRRPGAEGASTEADHRPDVYVDTTVDGPIDEVTGQTGVIVYRLSRIMTCKKALAATRLETEGDPPPDWLIERFDEGTAAEAEILHMVFGVKGAGAPGGDWKLLDPDNRESYRLSTHNNGMYPWIKPSANDAGTGQFTAEIPLGAGKIARGHLDGIAELYGRLTDAEGFVTGQRAVVEVKFLASAAFRQWKKDPLKMLRGNAAYWGQISGYVAASGLEGALYVVGEKQVVENTTTEGVVERTVTVGEVLVFWVGKADCVGLGKMKAQVAQVEKRALAGEFGECQEEMWPCPVWFLHTGEARDENEQVEKDVPEAMTEVFVAGVSKYHRGMVMERDGKKMKTEAKEVIEKVVAEVGLGAGGGKLKSVVGDVEWVVEDVPAGVVERKAYVKRYPKVGKGFKVKDETNKGENDD